MTERLPDVMTDTEWKAFIGRFNEKAPTGLRNKALFTLMREAGLRTCEVIALKTPDVSKDDLDGRQVTVLKLTGKGNKERRVYLNAEADRLLSVWMERKTAIELGRFCSVFTTLKGAPLNDGYIRSVCARKGENAGIDWRVHPHALRHTFATGLLRETGNLALVQDALGHARPETTRVYAKMTNADLARAMTRRGSEPEPPAPDAEAESQALAKKIAALTPEQRAALRVLLGEE